MQNIGFDDPEPAHGVDWRARSAVALRGLSPVDPVQEMAGAFRATGAGIVITDADLTIVAVNDAYAEAIGIAAAGLCATPLDGEPAACARTAVPFELEVTLCHRDGHCWPAWMRVDALRDDAGEVQRYVFTFTDISVLKREQDALRHQAHHDTLTGLPNRALLTDELQRCMARAQRHGRPMALMFIDVDHFKRVNDSLGHAVGDALLREFAQRLRQALRAEDLVARLGGDEFVAVVEDLRSADDAVAVARSILADLAPRFEVDGHVLHVSASIGIALFPGDADDTAGLMQAADAAMYLAKQQGRARLHLCAPRPDGGC